MTSAYYRGFALLKNHKKGANGWGKGQNNFLVEGIHGVTLHLANNVSHI
jgi:hypothetical protein